MNQRRGDAEQYAAPPPFIGSGIRQDLTSHNRQPKVHSGQIVGAEDFLPPWFMALAPFIDCNVGQGGASTRDRWGATIGASTGISGAPAPG